MDNLLLDSGTGDLALPPGGATWKDPEGIPGNKDDKPPKKLDSTSLPDGTMEIHNATTLRAALKEFGAAGKYSATEQRRHIVRRAKKLNLVGLLPASWGVTLEVMLEGMFDSDFIYLTADELDAENKVTSAAGRRKEAAAGTALPDGSFPIPNKTYLRKAIRLVGHAKNKARAKAHIIKRAKALGATSMLPEGWVSAEEIILETKEEVKLPEKFTSFLVLEGEVPSAIVLEQTEEEKANGTLRVKMPFYVGESITKPPHIPGKVYFPTALLSETISEGKKQISAGKQPLTVYARHQHAESSSYLPIGGIVGLEQEGRIGYAILEIEPTTLGKDAQILLQAKPPKINAVSLRSGPKRFELEEVKVNGENMYRPTKLLLDGVDFAPDAPAMPTYGLEILTAEATVTTKELPEPIKKKEVSQQVESEITLEAVRAKPEIVEEIEKPLLKRLDEEMNKNKSLTAEIATYKEKDAKNELNDYAREMAAKHPQKEEAEKVFLELAATCKTKEEFAAKLLPHFVNATASIKTVTAETVEDRIRKLFPTTGSETLTQENNEEEKEDEAVEKVGALVVPN